MDNRAIDGFAIEQNVLLGLKPFQRETVDHVFERMFIDDHYTTRFLVADEVGLGKTLVARGLIARTIRHLQDQGRKRIDIVYICSNADIATQNIRRLNVTGQDDFSLATRITLLPRQMHRLATNGINFVSFTPGTSFNLVSQSGRAEERAVLYRLLEYVLERSLDEEGVYRVLRANSGDRNFRDLVRWTPKVGAPGPDTLDRGLAEEFKRALNAQPQILERFNELVHRPTDGSMQEWRERARLIGDLRQVLARSCIDALQPSLVILDEFQRFRDLLNQPDYHDTDNIRTLAHHLFQQEGARTLLLSATPYKMYTLNGEVDDDHYVDFLRTVRFLMGPEETTAFTRDLEQFRHEILETDSPDGVRPLIRAKQRIERRLRRFMARTERITVSDDHSAMLEDRLMNDVRLRADDVRDFAALDRLSRHIGGGDVMEYWKSSPYLLNFMGTYKIKDVLRKAAADPERSRPLGPLIDSDTLLKWSALEGYEQIEPGNSRMRALVSETIEAGTWKLLWLPPSLPYYRGRGAYADPRVEQFTKRLIFSSWNVVPDAIALLVSYLAERRMMLSRDTGMRNTAEARNRLGALLTVRLHSDRPASMTTLALMYPSLFFAQDLDPLRLARELGAADKEIDQQDLLIEAERRIGLKLAPFARLADPARGAMADQRWYWVAPLLFDRGVRPNRNRDATSTWLGSEHVIQTPGTADSASDDHAAWADHVRWAKRVIDEGPSFLSLGLMPNDLTRALAYLAVGGPGTCALRSIGRVVGGQNAVADPAVRTAALHISWGFRSLYNTPEVMSMLRGRDPDDAYWRRAAEEGVNGNLQAVLDEYLHILPDALGIMHTERSVAARTLAQTIHDAVAIRAVNYAFDDLSIGDDGMPQMSARHLRARFALRFGRDSTDDRNVLQRSGAVRSAFNSPFWPFVLASTSVGQEGLDFHQYCHAVIHWNLPANPVDLEQREGRVHRFKGHAIRKNVAFAQRQAAFKKSDEDPWKAMFGAAERKTRNSSGGGLRPFWIYEGPAKIERLLMMLPLSREVEQMRRLKRSLAAYRMVFGQPRQEDLVEYLQGRMSAEDIKLLAQQIRIDLRPPSRRRGK